MKLMRNKEIRTLMILHLLLTAILTAVGAWSELPVPLLMIAGGVLYGLLHFLYTYQRYQAIARLSSAIDRILHGQEQILISGNAEGELSILQNEIEKMTLRLKESADVLQADKLHLADAIADISHQLRTPLTSMNLTVSMLSSEELSSERRLALTHDLRRSLRRIDWLIEALLKLSRLDAGAVQFKAEPIRAAQLIKKSLEPLAVTIELKEIALSVHAHEACFTGDMAWTTEALGNVIKNCVEHTPVGGSIDVSAEETALYTEIIVRDSGEGFSREDLPHLFERFYKGKSASSDSIGIGLALARTIISRQNGTIRASNRKEGGAQFSLRFYKGVI